MLKKLLIAVALGALVLVPASLADAVFHSTHAPLSPVGGAPLQSGFVQINHMNGPVNFAHDNYVLNGASPDSSYTVTLNISTASDASCASPFVSAPVATLATNGSGNGEVDAVFPPALIDALGIRNSTVHVYFTLSIGAGVAYTTGCLTAQLD
jgi:hypothetical protein